MSTMKDSGVGARESEWGEGGEANEGEAGRGVLHGEGAGEARQHSRAQQLHYLATFSLPVVDDGEHQPNDPKEKNEGEWCYSCNFQSNPSPFNSAKLCATDASL